MIMMFYSCRNIILGSSDIESVQIFAENNITSTQKFGKETFLWFL